MRAARRRWRVTVRAPGGTPREARRARGFTLVEVLVAIAILAGAVGATLVLMAGQARGTAALADNALARIAAENALVEVILAEQGGAARGSQEIGGQRFAWRATETETELVGLRLTEVVVTREGGDQVLASLATLTREQ